MPNTLADRIWPFLEGDRAVERVQQYYQAAGKYAGRRFEFIAGRGDEPPCENRFTAGDIVAVSMLSIRIPPNSIIQVLEDRSDELSGLLSRLPLDTDLWDATPEMVDDTQSRATDLWNALLDIDGIGWVTANKIMARKRPRLIPVYDQIVKTALSPNDAELWIPLREALRDQDFAMVNRLEEIRTLAGLTVTPSLLRVLDATVWMSSQYSLV